MNIASTSPNRAGSSLAIAEALATFRGELPQLLVSHRDEWVAYRGSERLGVGRDKDELFNDCLARGVRRKDLLVRKIECGRSLVEFEVVDVPPDVF